MNGNYLMQLGLGILGANDGRGNSFGRGMNSAANNMARYNQQEYQKRLQEMQMQQLQAQMSDNSLKRQQAAQQSEFINSAISELPQQQQKMAKAFPNQFAKQHFALPKVTDRKTAKDANDRLRYLDDKSLVFPEVKATSKADDKRDPFKWAKDLRGEFTDITKDFALQNDAYGRVMASAKDPSAAGDLALIFNYMKILDPGSTVREGEFSNAQNSGGVPDKVQALYNSVLNGERLNTTIRDDFLDRAGRLYGSAVEGYSKRKEEYTGLANRYQLDPRNVVINRQLHDVPDVGGIKPGTNEDGYIFKGGDPADPKNWVKQ